MTGLSSEHPVLVELDLIVTFDRARVRKVVNYRSTRQSVVLAGNTDSRPTTNMRAGLREQGHRSFTSRASISLQLMQL